MAPWREVLAVFGAADQLRLPAPLPELPLAGMVIHGTVAAACQKQPVDASMVIEPVSPDPLAVAVAGVR